MKNTMLRDLLFEYIREEKTRYLRLLKETYNEGKIFPDYLILEAYKQILIDVMRTEWISRNDVIHNACD